MEFGIKAVAREADKLVPKLKLGPGETTVFYGTCSNWTPVALDRIVVTDRRLLASPAMAAKITWESLLDDIVQVSADAGQKTVTVTTREGERLLLKKVPPQDHQRLLTLLGGECTANVPAEEAPATSARAATEDPDRGAASPKKEGAFAKFGAVVRSAAAEAETQFAEGQTIAGNLIHRATFGINTVEVYDKGYVRVGALLTKKSPFEKLRSAKYTFQVQDKSAGGRAVAGLMTGGLNYLTSKEKRVLLLTIATDRRVHTLSTEGGMGRSEDKIGLGIEAACHGVLAVANSSPGVPPSVAAPQPAVTPTLATQVRELAELHQQGLLSDEEFSAAKQRLIEGA